MANYTIDILAQIKGNEKLTRFSNTLKATSLEVKQLNKFLKEFQQGGNGLVKSFDTLNNILTHAKANFNAVASGTKLQEKAARELVLAEKQLNKEYKQREKLLNSLRASYTPMPLPGSGVGSDPVAKSIRRRRRKLAGNSQAYSSPVGPFQASQLEMIPGFGMGSLQGQSSPVGDKIARALANEKRLVKEVEAIRGKASKKRAANTKRQLALEKRSNAFVKKAIKEEAALRRKAEKEANELAAKRRARRRKFGSTASSAIIGGAFPLLFGQTGAAAVGGGVGGALGGAIGGQFGFALSIAGTAIGTAMDKSDKFAQSLARLNSTLATSQDGFQTTARDVGNLAKQLGITKEEAVNVLNSFAAFDSAGVRKSLALAFGDAGTFNAVAAAQTEAALAQQIFQLRNKIGNQKASELLDQLKIGDSMKTELALAIAIADANERAQISAVKTVTAYDRILHFAPSSVIGRIFGIDDSKIEGRGELRGKRLEKQFEKNRETRLENIKKSFEETRELMEQLDSFTGKFGETTKDAISGLDQELKKLQNPMYQLITLSETMAQSFEDSFKGLIKGTMSISDAFRNMFNRIADHYIDMVARTLAVQLQSGLLSLLGSLAFPSMIGDLGVEKGDRMAGSRYMDGRKRAAGGPVRGGEPYIVGEKGPEIFTPGVSGGITPNHALGGSTSISVNIDASGTSVEGSEPNGEELGRLVAAAIQSELIKEKRPGGLLS